MQSHIRQHRQQLTDLLTKVTATDSKGEVLALDKGLEAAIELIAERIARGGKLIFIGNGGSAAIASHMATDFWKNVGIKAMAFNDDVTLTCISNDNGYQYVFEKSIAMFGEKNDVLMAISSSGKSENILRGADTALQKGMAVVTFSGFGEDNPLRKKGKFNFYVPSNKYGHVEVIHHSLCHCLLDVIMQNKTQLISERTKIA